MFQATRRRLALWYTTVTAVLLLLFASGFYWYVRTTLIERIDDTLSHVVEVVRRSLVIEPSRPKTEVGGRSQLIEPNQPALLRLNISASFQDSADSVEDDHIDLEWFGPSGELLWSTFTIAPAIPLHPNSSGETVHLTDNVLLRQVTERVEADQQLVGYLRVSHPWFEVTKPTRQLVRDLALGTALLVGAVAAIGWLLSELAMAPVRESYQRLKQFTADASHELRSPIAIIQTNVQVALAEDNPDPIQQQQQLQLVERLTRRLGRLVDDLLFLARQDSGMMPMQQDWVVLEPLLKEVLEEQQLIASEQSIQLVLNSQSDPQDLALVQLQGDRDQLSRLFTNLVSNAIQHTPANGTVTLHLQRFKQPQPQVQVQVKDTGSGILPEALPYVFDRFYRADPARSGGSAGGSGLGLAIAKTIVENHQGQIQVESTLGSGTMVTVTLPAP